MEAVFDEAAWREPSLIVFDNLDAIVPAPSGPETEMNGEALYSAKNSQGRGQCSNRCNNTCLLTQNTKQVCKSYNESFLLVCVYVRALEICYYFVAFLWLHKS